MDNFSSILFVSRGLPGEEQALKQAIILLKNQQTKLHIAILYPLLPEGINDYKNNYEEFMSTKLHATIKQIVKDLDLNFTAIDKRISIDVESTNIPQVRIVQRVQLEKFDLVIKNAEVNNDNLGLKSFDQSLLRQCPCPVWLCHRLKDSENVRHVAVAIDADGVDKNANDLAIKLLQLANSIASHAHAKLSIISCWDTIFDERMEDIEYLGLPQKKATDIISEIELIHFKSLKDLLTKSKIGTGYELHNLRGMASEQITNFSEKNKVDLLVMGTVGRTGITGFIIGNTAENIFNKVSCSLLALKPKGFKA